MPSKEYLDGLLLRAEPYLPHWMKEDFHRFARAYAGGKRKGQIHEPTVLEKVTVSEMRPALLRRLPDAEITNAWHRLGQLYGGSKKKGEAVEDFVNAGVFVMEEMQRRKMDITASEFTAAIDDLIKSTARHRIRNEFMMYPVEIPLVEKFITIVGSQAVQNKIPADTDVNIRADMTDDQKAVKLNWDLLWVALRRHLDPNKVEDLHYIPNAQGSFTDHVPLYDLVLRRRPEYKTNVIEKSDVPVNGTGPENALVAFVGESPGRADSESGQPFSGPAREHLEEMAKGIGVDLSDCYLTNAYPFYLTDQNGRVRGPTSKELDDHHRDLYRELESVNPTIIIALGEKAAEGLGKMMDFELPHPSYIRRFGKPEGLDEKLASIKVRVEAEKVEKKLTDAQRKECDKETARIRESEKTLAAKRPHKFKAAKYTHPNGHPRCLICGDEETIGGICNAPHIAHDIAHDISKSITPFRSFTPPKPSMAAFTEFYSVDELWSNWAEKKLEEHDRIGIEPKWKGFRAIAERRGDKMRLWFEGKPDRNLIDIPVMASIKSQLENIEGDFILDMDLGIKRGGVWVRRNDITKLNAENPELDQNEQVAVTVFDLPYWKEDLSDKPFSFRRDRLEDVFQKALIGAKGKIFNLSPVTWIETKSELNRAAKAAIDEDYSEGLVAKTSGGKYETDGATNEMAKVKRVLELKVIVLDSKKTKNGAFVYRGGLLPSVGEKNVNTAELNDKKYVDLGDAFATSVEAKPGDIITVNILELLPTKDGQGRPELVWYGAMVQDRDDVRNTPYTTEQAVDLAERNKIMMKADPTSGKEEIPEEGGTRSAAAARNWANNWIDMLPKESGTGKFVYQHHWRGLEENETGMSEEKLLETKNSIHGDLRMQVDGGPLFGTTIFIGEAKDNQKMPSGDRLIDLPNNDNLQVAWKLQQPKEWLNVGVDKPMVIPPGGVAASRFLWSVFHAIDKGQYKITYAKEHFIEMFFDGGKLKGRYIFEFAPVGGGQRVWIVDKPTDQRPYLQSHRLEDEVRDQKEKSRKWIWYLDGDTPKRIDLSKAKPEDFVEADMERLGKSFECDLLKAEKQLVYGLVLIPDQFDKHGDRMTPEEIERTAHEYLKKYRNVWLQHESPAKADVVESYIVPADIELNGKPVKKGSWMMVVKVNDSQDWEDVRAGKYNAFSIGGTGRRSAI